MEDIFVTGATGLLGHNVIIELLSRGYKVKALVRDVSKVRIKHSNLRLCIGDINDIESVKVAMQNCSIAIHIAATTNQSYPNYSYYYKINTQATLNLFEVAKAVNIKRFIYISSANTIGFGSKNELTDESFPIQYPFTHSFYAQSKLESEQYLLSQKECTEIIILNPTFMLGSYDIKPSSGELVLMGYKKPILFIPKGGKNFVHVKDAAVAVCNAITMGRNGERYILGNENLSFKQFYLLQKELAGYKQEVFILPNFLLSLVGCIGNVLQLLRVRNVITKRNLQQLCIQEYYSAKKAIDELKLPQTSIDKAIEDSINWFRLEQKIK